MIGAGLSGLVAARTLHDHGHRVRVFEKSRAPGGRMATRRGGGFAYDHGAQYFTVRDARFQRYVESWVHDGLVAEWPHRVAVLECGRTTTKHDGPTRYVATPSMTALAKHLAQDIEVHYETHVSTLEANAHSRRRSWDLLDIDGQHLGRCDIVLAALPAPQAAVIAGGAIDLAARLEAVAFSPCWAVMTGFDQPLPIPADALFVRNSAVAWAARSSSKPGRDSRESWVLHGTAAWSHDAIERKAGEVAGALLHEFFAAACLAPVAPAHTAAHRWMYASATPPLDDGCLWDADQRFGACGDWCAGSRVEGAFLSGMAMAGRVLGLPEADAEPLTEAAA